MKLLIVLNFFLITRISLSTTNFLNKFFGTPMGSPISPLFADIVMDDLENDCLRILKDNHNCSSLFYYKYIDDTISCVQKKH